jgi:hypothetical protein
MTPGFLGRSIGRPALTPGLKGPWPKGQMGPLTFGPAGLKPTGVFLAASRSKGVRPDRLILDHSDGPGVRFVGPLARGPAWRPAARASGWTVLAGRPPDARPVGPSKLGPNKRRLAGAEELLGRRGLGGERGPLKAAAGGDRGKMGEALNLW